MNPQAATSLDGPLQTVQKSPFAGSYTTVTGQYLSASVARQIGNSKQALGYLNKAIGLGSSNDDLCLDAYGLALSAGDIDLAEHFASKVKQGADNVILSPKLLQAVVAMKKGNFAAAENLLNQAPEKGFGQLVLALLKSWALHAQNKPVPIEELTALMQQGGEFELLVKYQLAVLFESMGNDRAPYFDELAKMPYLPHHIVLTLAEHYKRIGNDKQRAQLMKRYEGKAGLQLSADAPIVPVLTPVEGAAEVFYSIASLLVSVDALDPAKVPLHLAYYLRPNFASVNFIQAQIAEQQGETITAINAYNALQEDSAYGLMASLQLAYLQQEVQNIPAALTQIEKLLKHHPESLSIWLAKGDVLRNEKKYNEAIEAYTAAIDTLQEKKAEHWPAFYSRAIAHERAGDWQKAEEDFLEALRLQPDQPEVLNYLGYSWLIQNRQLSQAKAMIQKAVRARPRDAHIIDSMGWAFYRLGEYEKSLSYLERAVNLNPRDATVNEHLGDVYWRMGYKIQARYQWERALTFGPSEPGQIEGLEGKVASGLPAADVPKSDVMQAEFLAEEKDQQRAAIQSEEEKKVE
ncbi:MAG: tetratricopeptide repeat protein [Rickettsiales bacterium]|nr:tetratricopeptide repeat protein [Rickettsiales bacterium]